MNPRKNDRSTKAEAAEPAPQITPMPFPGESPTVALAMAAGDKFGYHEEAKPSKAKTAKAKSAPKRKAAAKKKAAKPARKAKATKPARAKKGR